MKKSIAKLHGKQRDEKSEIQLVTKIADLLRMCDSKCQVGVIRQFIIPDINNNDEIKMHMPWNLVSVVEIQTTNAYANERIISMIATAKE